MSPATCPDTVTDTSPEDSTVTTTTSLPTIQPSTCQTGTYPIGVGS